MISADLSGAVVVIDMVRARDWRMLATEILPMTASMTERRISSGELGGWATRPNRKFKMRRVVDSGRSDPLNSGSETRFSSSTSSPINLRERMTSNSVLIDVTSVPPLAKMLSMSVMTCCCSFCNATVVVAG